MTDEGFECKFHYFTLNSQIQYNKCTIIWFLHKFFNVDIIGRQSEWRQTQTARTETATNRNGDKPKWRQTETVTRILIVIYLLHKST